MAGSVDRRAVRVHGERLKICANLNISGVCEIRGLCLSLIGEGYGTALALHILKKVHLVPCISQCYVRSLRGSDRAPAGLSEGEATGGQVPVE